MFLLAPLPPVQAPASLGLIPRPASIQMRPEGATLDSRARIAFSRGLEKEAVFLRDTAFRGSGFRLESARRGDASAIALRLDRSLDRLGPEGYRLTSGPEGVVIAASRPAGVFYGIQTLRQLLPAAFGTRTAGSPISVPGVEIEDRPRFAWRGLHLDVARHFMPKDEIFKFLDLMAFHKLNTFHWHLTDDQGWRLEIRRYPKLTSIGAWRKDTMLTYSPPTFAGEPHGGFYTQKEAREVVAYAAARHITVVPEIEMPGHAQAAIAAYPELGNVKEPLEVFTRWGVNPNVFNVEDGTIRFLQNVLDEVAAIFPSQFIHVGGDEVPKTQWKNSPSAQARMKKLGLKNEEELQSWFIHQMDEHLTKKGRRLLGWDEILEGGLAPGATVMSWRGIDGGIAAAKAGHDVVMAANGSLYLDYYQSRDTAKEPRGIGGYLPIQKVYAFEPIPAELNAEEAKHILGAQGQLWTEYIRTPRHLEYMAYPRAAALSEVVWSPVEGKSFADFSDRLKIHAERLRALDVAFRPLDEPTVPDGEWRSGEVGPEWTTRTWPITKTLVPGVYDVLFAYTGGAHRLDIARVEMLAGDEVVAFDEHEGQTGGINLHNRYRLDLTRLPQGAPLTLRAKVRADGGSDSAGEISLVRGS